RLPGVPRAQAARTTDAPAVDRQRPALPDLSVPRRPRSPAGPRQGPAASRQAPEPPSLGEGRQRARGRPRVPVIAPRSSDPGLKPGGPRAATGGPRSGAPLMPRILIMPTPLRHRPGRYRALLDAAGFSPIDPPGTGRLSEDDLRATLP